jgi:hypothetical protein
VNNRVGPRDLQPRGREAHQVPADDGRSLRRDPVQHRGPGAERNEGQTVTRVDYQRTANDTIFGRYMATFHKQGIAAATNVIEAQSQLNVGVDNLAESAAFGDTRVFGPSLVNGLRLTYNHTNVDRYNIKAVEPKDLGINVYTYEPGRMNVDVTGGFAFGTNAGYGITHTRTFQVAEDLTLVHDNHQIAVGANIAYWKTFIETCARCGGQWNFNGRSPVSAWPTSCSAGCRISNRAGREASPSISIISGCMRRTRGA